MQKKVILYAFAFMTVTVFSLATDPLVARASLIDELKEKITQRADEIDKLESEIRAFEEQIDQTEKETNTLQSVIKTLNITDKKLTTDIRVTEQKTAAAGFEIEKLEIEIAEREKQIEQNTSVLGEIIRHVNELESRSTALIILSNLSFGTFWSSIENLARFQVSIRENLKKLESLKDDLETKKNLSEKEKKNLIALSLQFTEQKNIIKENKNEKNLLLAKTKNKESMYKTLLEDRLAQKDALEKEIQEFEVQIQIEIDPASLPETGTGILRWPLDSVKITQYFGNTPFASQNPQVYSSKGHNGIDLRAPIGTPIKSAAGGIVAGAGDTDKDCYKVSYGKWGLIKHDTGLSTLYAHLSLIRVQAGQDIDMGDILGYSGNTGYSTGPHLHFGVFVSKAIVISSDYKSRICGTFLTLPLSAPNGYLNPLSYLPYS